MLVAALLFAACGGPDRETFLNEANAVCRDRAASQEALAGLPRDELLPAQTRLYEQGLDRLRALEPPEEDRAEHADWVQAEAAVVVAWRRYAATPDRRSARERVIEEYEYASALAGRLGLDECDS